MKKLCVFAIYSIFLITLMGCVVGKKVPYEKMKVEINYSGTKSIALAVYDQREMVVKGSRKADFVGYQLSDIGVAWPMGTKSGKNFTDVIQEIISQSFKSKGYTVSLIPTSYKDNYDDIKTRLIQSSSDRLMIIKFKKLQLVMVVATMIDIDVDIEVFDKSGNTLAFKNFQKSEKIATDILGTNYKKYAPEYLEKEIASWMNDPQITKELK
jgi:hypothetical protein